MNQKHTLQRIYEILFKAKSRMSASGYLALLYALAKECYRQIINAEDL